MHRPYKEDALCPNGNCHVVHAGDTLYTISKFYNISLDDLVEANPCIEPDLIAPGQVICIPLPAPPSSCPPGAASYIVQKGDSFYSIAKKYRMQLSALLRANPNVNPDALLTGQSICIPKISSTYNNEILKIKFMYPYRWSKIDNERYEGLDGFFRVSAISSNETLQEICSKEVNHKLKPYGSHPQIINAVLDGYEACFITPSSDQPMEMRSQSALIVKYGNPLTIDGIKYNYLIIHTNRNHLRSMADTLEFIDE